MELQKTKEETKGQPSGSCFSDKNHQAFLVPEMDKRSLNP